MQLKASSFWKDSPSSFYWDVWSRKLIKTNEKGVQIGMSNNYGCKCQYEGQTKIGMYYDSNNKEVSFYKNNVNQGIAFKNVPDYYFPSIDIWFSYGSVEITNIENLNLYSYNSNAIK